MPTNNRNIRRFGIAAATAALVASGPIVAQQPVVLKLSSPAPPPSYVNTDLFGPWAKLVSEASGGTMRIDLHAGGTLGNFGVTYDRVMDGVADIGFILTAFAGGKFKQHDVAALPFEAKTSEAASVALWKLYERGLTAGEFEGVKPIALWTFPNAAIHSKNPVATLADLNGKKIAIANAITGKIAVALGGAPVTLRPDETYQALSRGLADVSLMPYTGMAVFKINEVTKFHLDAALGSDAATLFMSRKKYDSLPPQAKQAIDKHSGLALSRQFGIRTDKEWNDKRNIVKAAVTELGGDEEARWRKAVAGVATDWAGGIPNGAKVLEAFRAEVAASGKQ